MNNKNNTGNGNTGDWNTGDWNTGHLNTGDWNTGNRNTGNWNTGNWNTGNWNTGNWNTGHRNTGNWNTGHRNTGSFCTETPCGVLFDKPVPGMSQDEVNALIPVVVLPEFSCVWVDSADMTPQEKQDNPSHKTIGGFLRVSEMTIQQAFPLTWAEMDEETKNRFLSLPNFDAEKFLKCTGVDVRVSSDTITVNGVVYKRVG